MRKSERKLSNRPHHFPPFCIAHESFELFRIRVIFDRLHDEDFASVKNVKLDINSITTLSVKEVDDK
jgi:hypothetical protein